MMTIPIQLPTNHAVAKISAHAGRIAIAYQWQRAPTDEEQSQASEQIQGMLTMLGIEITKSHQDDHLSVEEANRRIQGWLLGGPESN